MEADIPLTERTPESTRDEISGKPAPLIGRMIAVLACVASSVAWLWFTSPKPNYLWNLTVPILFLFFCAVVVPAVVLFVGGFLGLFKLDLFRLTAASRKRSPHLHVQRSRYYTFALLFTGAAMISIVFHVPLYARFALSYQAMDAFVTDVLEHPDAPRPATLRVGSYVLETTPLEREDGALLFHLSGESDAGFTYSATPISHPGSFKGGGGRLGGGWYWFSNE